MKLEQSVNKLVTNKLLKIKLQKSSLKNCYYVLKMLARFYFNKQTQYQVRDYIAHSTKMEHYLEIDEYLEFILTPYISSAYSFNQRLSRINQHFKIVSKLGEPFTLLSDHQVVLYEHQQEFNEVGKLKLILERSTWLNREGLLVVSIVVGQVRAYSIAFSFCNPENISCLVGALQGRNPNDIEDINVLYKLITKALFGLRPRDVLMEAVKLICKSVDVNNLSAVADEYRHHRHKYFNKQTFDNNYNHYWLEKLGALDPDSMFYILPIEQARKKIEDIPSKKRSMYRKRYSFLDKLEMVINDCAVNQAIEIKPKYH